MDRFWIRLYIFYDCPRIIRFLLSCFFCFSIDKDKFSWLGKISIFWPTHTPCSLQNYNTHPSHYYATTHWCMHSFVCVCVCVCCVFSCTLCYNTLMHIFFIFYLFFIYFNGIDRTPPPNPTPLWYNILMHAFLFVFFL